MELKQGCEYVHLHPSFFNGIRSLNAKVKTLLSYQAVNAKLGGEGEASSSKQLNPSRELLLSPVLNVIVPCLPQHSGEEQLHGLSFSL